ncbi:hypothetical protein HK102_003574, partial [Quaeritorhiza haematococci]
AAEPLFVFTLSYLLLHKSYNIRTLFACVPIVVGVSLATVTELSFSSCALFFALFSNVAVALRNLLSKGQGQTQQAAQQTLKNEERDAETEHMVEAERVWGRSKVKEEMNGGSDLSGKVVSRSGFDDVDIHQTAISIFTPLELFTISSFLAMWLILPIWGLVTLMVGIPSSSQHTPIPTTSSSLSSASPFSSWGVWSDLFLGAISHFLYTLFSFQVLSQISPLSHAVANVAKRLATIVTSCVVFRNPVTWVQLLGILVAHGGVGWFLYLNAGNMGHHRDHVYKRCNTRSSDSQSGTISEDGGKREQVKEGEVRPLPKLDRTSIEPLPKLDRTSIEALQSLSQWITKVDWNLQSSVHPQETVEHIKLLLSQLLASKENQRDSILWEYDGTPSQFFNDTHSVLIDLAKPHHTPKHQQMALKRLSKMLSQALQQQHDTRQINRIKCIRKIQRTISTTIKSIIDPERDPVLFLSVPEHWNLGDSFISAGSLELFNDFSPGIVPLPCTETDCVNHFDNITRLLTHHGPNSVLLFQGGGNFGDLWRWSQSERNAFVQNFPTTRIVFGPQSVHYENKTVLKEDVEIFGKHTSLTMLFRDYESMQILRDAGVAEHQMRWCPDMAFMLGPRWPVSDPVVDILFLSRQDKEKITSFGDNISHLKAFWSSSNLTFEDHDWADAFTLTNVSSEAKSAPIRDQQSFRVHIANKLLSRGRVIVTDRLHAVILATLMGKPHVFVENSYGKIRNMMRATFGGVGGECGEENLEGYGVESWREVAERSRELVRRVRWLERVTG